MSPSRTFGHHTASLPVQECNGALRPLQDGVAIAARSQECQRAPNDLLYHHLEEQGRPMPAIPTRPPPSVPAESMQDSSRNGAEVKAAMDALPREHPAVDSLHKLPTAQAWHNLRASRLPLSGRPKSAASQSLPLRLPDSSPRSKQARLPPRPHSRNSQLLRQEISQIVKLDGWNDFRAPRQQGSPRHKFTTQLPQRQPYGALHSITRGARYPVYAHSHSDHAQPVVNKHTSSRDPSADPSPSDQVLIKAATLDKLSGRTNPGHFLARSRLAPRRPSAVSDRLIRYVQPVCRGRSASVGDAHADLVLNRHRLGSIDDVLACSAPGSTGRSHAVMERAAPLLNVRIGGDAVTCENSGLSSPAWSFLQQARMSEAVARRATNFSLPIRYRRGTASPTPARFVSSTGKSQAPASEPDIASPWPSSCKKKASEDSGVAMRPDDMEESDPDPYPEPAVPVVRECNGSIYGRLDHSSNALDTPNIINLVTIRGDRDHHDELRRTTTEESEGSLERTVSNTASEDSIQRPLRVINGASAHRDDCTCASHICSARRMRRKLRTCRVEERLAQLVQMLAAASPDGDACGQEETLLARLGEMQRLADALKREAAGGRYFGADESATIADMDGEEGHFRVLISDLTDLEHDCRILEPVPQQELEEREDQPGVRTVGTARSVPLMVARWPMYLPGRRHLLFAEPVIAEENAGKLEMELRMEEETQPVVARVVYRLRRVGKRISLSQGQ